MVAVAGVAALVAGAPAVGAAVAGAAGGGGPRVGQPTAVAVAGVGGQRAEASRGGQPAAATGLARQRAEGTHAEVALTFDDLPAHGPIPPGSSRVEIAKRIIEALQSHKAPPVYGFINAKDLGEHPEDAEVLRLWRAAAYPLGNHTYSHMDLDANTAEAFEQDVLANEATLRTYMDGQDWRWFRYPYLREGDTLEKHRAIRGFLQRHAYRVAEVTLSFDDYAYNEPYARCVAKQDTASIDWLKESYLARAAESLTSGQEDARALFQHDISHVMLLHIGGFETVMLPKLLDLLQDRGFTLMSLPNAANDHAFAIDPDLPRNWDGLFLQQMLRARHAASVPPPAPPPGPASNIFEKLGGLCR